MSWDKGGNLICDWCYKIIILKEDATPEKKEFHQGWTKCFDCVEKATPFSKRGNIEDLPDDYWAPKDSMREFFKEGKITKLPKELQKVIKGKE